MRKYVLAFLICFCCTIVYTNPSQAQLCSGSLGDPVVNTTFGAVSTSLGPKTNYNFVTNDCPEDGYYTIAPATSGCFNFSWHSVSEDHTPNDANGMMMVVNASYTHGDFYVDTVRELCSNTTYEFAAWLLNLLLPSSCGADGIKPNITFSIENIDGTLIKSFNTSDIPTSFGNDWKQYGFFFSTGTISDVVLRMTNNANGGCGNDIALDDITFRPCGPNITAFIEGNNNSTDFNICQGNAASLLLESNVSAEYSDPAYQWQQSNDNGVSWTDITGATALNFPVNIAAAAQVSSTQYRLTVGKASNINIVQCRIASNVISIHVNEKPSPDITSNSPVCTGKDIVLTAHKGSIYNWTGPNNFTSQDSTIIIHNAKDINAGVYKVDISSAAGCSTTTSTNVIVNENPVAAISTAVAVCEGSSTPLQGSGGLTYRWSPPSHLSNAGVANPVASPIDSTAYTLVVTNSKGCTDTAYTNVYVWKKPRANAGQDKQVMEGDTVSINGAASGTNVTYNWTPNTHLNTAQLLQPTATPTENITYTLHVQSLQGCGMASDEMFIRVFKKVDVPNAFSPNGDGIHDKWILKNIETYPEADITVFNRYGQLLYKAKGTSQPWDGTYNGRPLPVASYYYVIDLKNNFPKLSGWIMLLR